MGSENPYTTRRGLLRGGALAVLGLAGCTTRPGTGSPPGSSTPGSPTELTDASPTGDAVRWHTRLGGSVRHPPTVQDGVVYVGGGTNDRGTSDSDRIAPTTSENVYALAATDGGEQWRYEAAAGVMSPTVVRDAVFVVVGWNAGMTGEDNRLVRIDPGGTGAWETDAVDSFLSLLAVGDGIAYLGTSDDALGLSGEQLSAVRTATGQDRWSVEAGDTRRALLQGDTLYGVEGGRSLTAFATGDGSERWHRDMRSAGGRPRTFDGTMYLRATEENAAGNYPVVAVRAEDGSERWRFSAPVDEPFVPTGAVASPDGAFVTEYDGWLFGVDPADGSERWRYEVAGDTRDPPVVVDGTVYLTSITGSLHAVDATTGEQEWTRTLPAHPWIAAGNSEGVVVRGKGGEGSGSYLRGYAPDGTVRWSFSHPGNLTRPAVDGLDAYVGTEDGDVFAIGDA